MQTNTFVSISNKGALVSSLHFWLHIKDLVLLGSLMTLV
jgi:hypothetical protein